jgi:hypothetical protein
MGGDATAESDPRGTPDRPGTTARTPARLDPDARAPPRSCRDRVETIAVSLVNHHPVDRSPGIVGRRHGSARVAVGMRDDRHRMAGRDGIEVLWTST